MLRFFRHGKAQAKEGPPRELPELMRELDPSGRKAFIDFTLQQRRPHLHRLFATAARRAKIAGLSVEADSLSTYAKLIRGGAEDEDLYRKAASSAEYSSSKPSAWVERLPAIAEMVHAAR